MQCRYCQAWNDQEERRCVRCGRRLYSAGARPAPETYPLTSSTAPVLERIQGGAASSAAPLQGPVYQRSLLQQEPFPQDARGGGKVIQIPALPTLPPKPRRAPRNDGAVSAGPHRAPVSRADGRRAPGLQQRFDFHAAAAPSGALRTGVEAVIYCDAKVAVPTHRAMAAAVDTSLVLIGLGLFLGVFFLSGGDIVLSRDNAPFLVGAALGVAFFYRLLWYSVNVDTPGMGFAGLRLVNFDGRAPGREQRRLRMAACLLSFVSVGLGLILALVDEEGLTWHDHISKTFPTADR